MYLFYERIKIKMRRKKENKDNSASHNTDGKCINTEHAGEKCKNAEKRKIETCKYSKLVAGPNTHVVRNYESCLPRAKFPENVVSEMLLQMEIMCLQDLKRV